MSITVTWYTHAEGALAQVDYAPLAAGHVASGYVEIKIGDTWYRGTDLLQRYGQNELYAKVFCLEPNTSYLARVLFWDIDATLASVFYIDGNVTDTTLPVVNIEVDEQTIETLPDEPTLGPRTEVHVSPMGNDGNPGTSLLPVLTLARVSSIVDNAGGWDIIYHGKNFFNEQVLSEVSGVESNWNRFMPADDSAQLIGYRELNGPWTHVGDDVYRMSCSEKIARVTCDGRVLYGCRTLDSANMSPYSDPSIIALKASATGGPATGEITNITAALNKYTVTSAAHGRSVGDWVVICPDTLRASKQMLIHVLKIMRIEAVTPNTFDLTASGPAATLGEEGYISGGEWERIRPPGFNHKPTAGELYVRMPDNSNPGSGRLKGAYASYLFLASGCDYVEFTINADLAMAHSNTSTDTAMLVGNSVGNSGFFRLIDSHNFIIRGRTRVCGVYLDATTPCSKGLIELDADAPGTYEQTMSPNPECLELAWEKYSPNCVFAGFQFHTNGCTPLWIGVNTHSILVRDSSLKGGTSGFYAGNGPTKHVDFLRCDMGESANDVIEIDNGQQVGCAVLDSYLHHASNCCSLSPFNDGPLWLVNNFVREAQNDFLKHGDGNAAEGHGIVVLVNNSFENTRIGAVQSTNFMQFNGVASGSVAINNLTVCSPSPDSPGAWAGYIGPVKTDRLHYWDTNAFHVTTLGWPLNVYASSYSGVLHSSSSLTLDSTHAKDAQAHISNSTSTGTWAMDARYTFYLGANPTPRNLALYGNTTRNGVYLHIWNYATEDWDLLMLIPLKGGSVEYGFELTDEHARVSDGELILRFSNSGQPLRFTMTVNALIVNMPLIQFGTDGAWHPTFESVDAQWFLTGVHFVNTSIVQDYPFDDEGFALSPYDIGGRAVPGITDLGPLVPTLGRFSSFARVIEGSSSSIIDSSGESASGHSSGSSIVESSSYFSSSSFSIGSSSHMSSSSDSESEGCLSYCDREDVEAIFGKSNVRKWADLDNNGDEGDIDARVITMMCNATDEISNRCRSGPGAMPFDPVPRQVRFITARLAGINLHMNRGITDTDDADDPMQVHRDEVDKFVARFLGGALEFDTRVNHNAPAAYRISDEDDTSTY